MKNHIQSLLFLLILVSCQSNDHQSEQQVQLFDKGDKINSDHFDGTAWYIPLVAADSLNFNSVGSVIFEPGAKTFWHLHPAGQIIIATRGVGYYQEKGEEKRILKKGDVVKCPPNVHHWHGAAPEQQFIQIAITGRANGPTEWLERVSNEAYLAN